MQQFADTFSFFTDVQIPFAISDDSKDVSLKIILFNKNQQLAAEDEQANSIKIPSMILRMEKDTYGQFETSVSLKSVVKALYANNQKMGKKSQKEEARECYQERQLYENLKQNFKCLHFVFETDDKCLRTDRYYSMKQTANCLGPIAAHALGV